jgi:acyl-CoA synthetase (AMP-forming)/AMP-acid ligase II
VDGPVTVGPDMTVRQIEGEFETVVDVLRAAAVVNADVEAYVEPATADRPPAPPHLRRVGPGRRRRGRAVRRHGVTRGSVVCLLLPSSIDYMVCYAAATRLGAITSGINLRLGAAEVRSILERTRPTVTVVDDGATAAGRPVR